MKKSVTTGRDAALPGFEFISGPRARMVRDAETVMRDVLESYGFEEILTPIVMPLDTLLQKLTPLSRSWQLFSFLTPWGEPVALRFENTNAIARFIASGQFRKLPVRVFYICPMLRNETLESLEDEKGRRLRQFLQCGWETAGFKGEMAVAESIVVGLDLLEQFGLCGVCRLSDTGFLEDIYRRMGLDDEQSDALHGCLDRKEWAGVEKFFACLESGWEGGRGAILSLAEMRGTATEVIPHISRFRSLYRFSAGPVKRLKSVCSMLDSLGYGERILLDMSIARSRTLYRGLIWQFDIPGSPECGAGGECPDVIEKQGGRSMRLVGGGFGFERLLTRKRAGRMPRSDVVVWGRTPHRALLAAKALRRRGMRVELEVTGRNLKAARRFAKAIGAKFHADGRFL